MEELYKSLLKLDRLYQDEIIRSQAALMQIRIEANSLAKNAGANLKLNNNESIEIMLHELSSILTKKYLQGLKDE